MTTKQWILKTINSSGSMSVADLRKGRNRCRASMYNHVRALVEAKMLKVAGTERQGSRGAKAVLFDLTAAARRTLP